MLVRVGLVVTCSVAAYTLSQLRNSGDHKDGRQEMAELSSSTTQNIAQGTFFNPGGGSSHKKKNRKSYDCGGDTPDGLPKTPEEEVKRVNSTVIRNLSCNDVSDGEHPLPESGGNYLLPEFEALCSEDLQFPSETFERDLFAGSSLPSDPNKGDTEVEVLREERQEKKLLEAPSDRTEDDNDGLGSAGGKLPGGKAGSPAKGPDSLESNANALADEMASRVALEAVELQSLRKTIDDLKERELRLEGELLEYYGLQERENELLEMQQKISEQSATIAGLKSQIEVKESQCKKLASEVSANSRLKENLTNARARVQDLQKQLQLNSGQSTAELLMLKNKVSILEAREQEGNNNRRDLDLEKKLQLLRELEVEVVELRRTCKDIQHQKRELIVKLSAAEDQVAYYSNLNETVLVAQAEATSTTLRNANEDLCRQVEGLQNDRFSEVEELVYLRWVNACLRYELRNYQAPTGKPTAIDLNKNLSPKSQAMAKQMMLEHAGPDLGSRGKDQVESGYESTSSETSTPTGSSVSESAGDHSDLSLDSGRLTKKPSLIRRLKKWTGKREDKKSDSMELSSESMERYRKSPYQHQSSNGSKGPLESLILRNMSDAVEITTYGAQNVGDDSPGISEASSHDGSSSAEINSGNSRPKSSLPRINTKQSESELNGVAASFQLMSKSVIGTELAEKYPAFKERHKAAIQRENTIKEKAAVEREKVMTEKAQEKSESTPKRHYTGGESVVTNSAFLRNETVLSTDMKTTNKRVEIAKMSPSEVEKRALRKAKPPPKRSAAAATLGSTQVPQIARGIPPPPPPPPPPPSHKLGAGGAPPPPPPPPGGLNKLQGATSTKVQRAPGVVEFYQSLMKRDGKEVSGGPGGAGGNPEARNNMIGEIENRSTHLLAIKADVETQGEFVESLAAEVRAAAYTDIEDVVDFVNWLDDELSFLVDEVAVLKHFDWPEGKADALREASFEYRDLKKLLQEVTVYEDKPELPCDAALKKILKCLEKMEQSVYALLRTRDMAIARYKDFNVPTQWLLDTGLVGKIKEAAVRLARLYMKRVSSELDQIAPGSEKEPLREFLLLQGVRFAFRVHQFAGGFDAESMAAFEALRNKAHVQASSS